MVMLMWQQIPRPMAFTPQTPTNQPMSRRSDADDNELMVTLLTTFSSLYSGTTVSMLAIAGLVSHNFADVIDWLIDWSSMNI